MVYGYIYKIEFPNGKNYIGLTTRTLQKRWIDHNKNAKNTNETTALYNAIRFYNIIDTFELIEIDTAETKEELCQKEIEQIKIHNSYYKDNGYNMTYGGEGLIGYEFTEEDKEKISDGVKKYYQDNPQARQICSERNKKYYEEHPEEGQKISDRLKKYYQDDPGARQKHSEGVKKYYQDNPKARQKCSDAQQKRFQDHYQREKLGLYKPFEVFEKDGTYINSFNYQFVAREYLQKTYNITGKIRIDQVLNEKIKSSHGFIFKYKK